MSIDISFSHFKAKKNIIFSDRSKSTSRPESRDNSVPRETGESLKGSPNITSAAAEKFAIAIIEEFTHNNDPEVCLYYILFIAQFFLIDNFFFRVAYIIVKYTNIIDFHD